MCRCVRVGVSYFSLSLQRSILSTHAYTHTDVNTHIQTCIHTCIHTYRRAYTHTCSGKKASSVPKGRRRLALPRAGGRGRGGSGRKSEGGVVGRGDGCR